MASNQGVLLPAEHAWKSRGLLGRSLFSRSKGHIICHPALVESGFLPAICDTANVLLNGWIGV